MENVHSADSSFWIRCVGYKQNQESFFTIGQEYEVKRGGYLTSDTGFTYIDPDMKLGSDPESWWLAGWYQFEIVNDVTVSDCLDISFEDAVGFA